jgi:lysozyme
MHFDLDFFAALRRMKDRRTRIANPSPEPRSSPTQTPVASPRTIGSDGLALIRRFEGCAKRRPDGLFEAYPDPGTGGDPWTIGWGATGRGIRQGTLWTQEQCDARLETDLVRYARDVARAVGDSPTTQAQFDALVSFHYNTGAIARATLTKLHKAGKFDDAAAQFGKWIHAGGKRLTGLVRRREAEAALYRSA